MLSLKVSGQYLRSMSLEISEASSSLFFSTRNSKDSTCELRNSTRDSILEFLRIENRVSSRVS